MTTHSSVLAWRIPGTGAPGGLPSLGSHRVGHDWSDLAAAAAAVVQWDSFRLAQVFERHEDVLFKQLLVLFTNILYYLLFGAHGIVFLILIASEWGNVIGFGWYVRAEVICVTILRRKSFNSLRAFRILFSLSHVWDGRGSTKTVRWWVSSEWILWDE